jgi:hypothetical protein
LPTTAATTVANTIASTGEEESTEQQKQQQQHQQASIRTVQTLVAPFQSSRKSLPNLSLLLANPPKAKDQKEKKEK